jgi:predicted dehydrogenase
MSKLRTAVVGAGRLGGFHAQKLSQNPQAELVAVADPFAPNRNRVAAECHCESVADHRGLIGRIDAAVIASPTGLHYDLAKELLEAGVHLLVEKPLCNDSADAEALVALARRKNLVLQVGHVERFNPAVLELDNLLGDVVHVSAARISPYTSRIRESVITDLMIHDLDVVRSIARSAVVDVECMGMQVRSDTTDLASALLRFESGMTASLTASRVGQQKIRELRITQADRYITVDLIRQDVTINRVEHSEFLSSQGARYRQSGVVEIPFLEHQGEPLLLELQEFVRAVTTGTPPRVTAADGVETVRLIERVEAAASSSGRPKH